MYTNPSLVTKGNGSAESKSFEIILMDAADILYTPPRDNNGILMVGNFQMKPGKYVTRVQVTSSKTTLPLSSEGEEDNVSVNALPEFTVPGSSLEAEELMQNWLNRSVIAAVHIGACNDPNPFYRIYGSKCAPLTLMPEGQNDNDATNLMFKFQQFAKTGLLPARYTGTFTYATVNTVAADATTVDVANGSGEYQLTDNTGATIITDLTNAVVGEVYTLIGSGGSNPATIESSNTSFFLAGAVDYVGLSGTTITFQALDNGGGDIFFLEKSRTS